MTPQTIKLTSISDYEALSTRLAQGFTFAAKTQKIKKERTSAEYLFLIITMGSELGLNPMQSINNIDIINGQVAIWGDGMLAVVRNSGQLESFKESFSKGKDEKIVSYDRKKMQENFYTDDYKAICKLKRTGYDEQVYEFSVKDAKIAKLWCFNSEKQSFLPWYRYPDRMLQMRARSWALRDNFADYLNGLYAIEEARDIDHDPSKKEKPVEIKKEEKLVANDFNALWENHLNKNNISKEDKENIEKKLKTFVQITSEVNAIDGKQVLKEATVNFESFMDSFRVWYKGEK